MASVLDSEDETNASLFEGRDEGILGRIIGAFGAERERWPLWFPVGIGAGVAVYFTLSFEPGFSAGLILLGLSFVLGTFGIRSLVRGRRGGSLIIVALILGAPALGFTAAKFQTSQVAAPVIHNRVGPATVEGRFARFEPSLKGPRITIDAPKISRVAPETTPQRVRIRLRHSLNNGMLEKTALGSKIRIRAILLPPPGPAVPGGFDFARASWFKGIGAVGFAVGRPEPGAKNKPDEETFLKNLSVGFHNAIRQFRRDLFTRITEVLLGEAGGIAAALMTGERSANISYFFSDS
jgi:competence protein ComEC